MSATNRGAIRKPRDYYCTPQWCINALVRDIRSCWFHAGQTVLDAGAGDGRIGRALYNAGAARFTMDGGSAMVDIDPLASDVEAGDFLDPAWRRGCTFNLVVSNPPFSLAREFLEAALRRAPAVAILARLNFLGSSGRVDLFRKHPPTRILMLTPRPSFSGGGTDSCEYGWIWFGSSRHLADPSPFGWAARQEVEG